MTLVVHCEPHLAAVRAFADSIGQRDQLETELAYLADFREGVACHLHWDSSPHSFYFEMLASDASGELKRWFNGGLIFHRGQSNGVGAPEFAALLTPRDAPHWSVHT